MVKIKSKKLIYLRDPSKATVVSGEGDEEVEPSDDESKVDLCSTISVVRPCPCHIVIPKTKREKRSEALPDDRRLTAKRLPSPINIIIVHHAGGSEEKERKLTSSR